MNIPAKYRLWLYLFAAAFLIASFVIGALAPTQYAQGLDAFSKTLALVTSLLASVNVTPDAPPTK